MRAFIVVTCLLALVAPPASVRASGGGPAATPARRAPQPSGTPSPGTPSADDADAARAIAAARADLDSLVASLIQERAQPPRDDRPIELEVIPPVLTSDAPPAIASDDAQPDLSWLQGIELPDIPIRWHDQLLEVLRYYREDPRGRAHIRSWMERSGRYEAMIRQKFKAAGLPQDLLYVSMVESGYDPLTESSAGAVGLWQFVQNTAVDYGIEKTRWVDQRRDPERATDAATQYLKELHDKLGTWPLTLAAFNMGYGAMLRSLRKYNTNDFWLLSRLEAGLPYETVIYVAKIMACAIVAHNPERFGLGDIKKDPAVDVTLVQVPGGVGLGRLASAASISVDTLLALNPELVRKRIPPDVKQWGVHIPRDKAERFAKRWPELQPEAPTHAVHVLRFGERIKDVAEMYGTTERKLRALNDLSDTEPVLPGARIDVPDVEPEAPRATEPAVVGVPGQAFHYPKRRRIFYRVQGGDRATQIATFFHVSLDEVRAWNAISTSATLHQGMILQLFVPPEVDLSRAVYLPADQVRALVVGSDEFYQYHEALRDRVRVHYRVQNGDSVASLAARFDLSIGSIARINGFNPNRTLVTDSEIILYVPSKDAAKLDPRQAARD